MQRVWGAVELGFGGGGGQICFQLTQLHERVHRALGKESWVSLSALNPLGAQACSVCSRSAAQRQLSIHIFPLLVNVFISSHPILHELTNENKTCCFLMNF